MRLIGHIQNTALSGVEAYALLPGDCDFLDGLVIENYKSAMGSKAYKFSPSTADNNGEVDSSLSNSEILKYWKLAQPSTEIRIRRITMYQTMARCPEDSVLDMAAAFGKMREEENRPKY